MDEPENQSFLTKFQLKLAASRFFTFSLLLHVVIVIMAGSVVIYRRFTDPPDFAAEGGGSLVQEEASAEPPPAAPDNPQATFTPTAPTVNAPAVDVIATTSQTSTTTFQVQAAVPSIKAPASADMNKELAKAVASSAGKGMGNLPATMGARAGGTARAAAMMKMGGKDKSEKAVLSALRWLKTNQNKDGSWSSGGVYQSAMTGLAILCYLGHGETPESPEFGPTVKKGIDWVLTNGIKNQGRLSMEAQFSGPGVYAHAIGAYALGEYYTMTKDDRVKDVLTQAVSYIVDGQTNDGGWLYSYNKGPDSDTSVTGWQVQALKAAHLTGLNMPGVDEALDKAMLDFKRVQTKTGGFGYHTPDQAPGYTLAGVGVLCTYFWKGDKDKIVRDGIKYILDETEKNKPVDYKGANANLYVWYYDTQACLMFGGNAWSKWNRWFQDNIADAQSPDGSWPVPPAVAGKGPPGPQQDPAGAGPYYRTTLCTLMLEVFYRYMPSNK